MQKKVPEDRVDLGFRVFPDSLEGHWGQACLGGQHYLEPLVSPHQDSQVYQVAPFPPLGPEYPEDRLVPLAL